MWKLHQMAQQTHSRPSQLVGIQDKLEAYLLDSCVVTFGIIMDNALHERESIGPPGKHDWKPKYTLAQLLDSKFYLPDPSRSVKAKSLTSSELPPFSGGLSQILALAAENTNGVKTWRYVPPEPDSEP